MGQVPAGGGQWREDPLKPAPRAPLASESTGESRSPARPPGLCVCPERLRPTPILLARETGATRRHQT